MPPSNNYTTAKGEFLNSVVNKIGKQIWSSKAYVNPLKRLKKGFIENANDIEEIYIARAVGTAQDPDGVDTLKRVKSTVKTQYHTQDYEKSYTVSVSDKQVRQGFLTSGGVTKVAEKILESLHTGYEYDEYIATLDVLEKLAKAAPSTAKKKVTDVTDLASAKAFTKEVKKDVKKMARRSTTYATVENHSKPSDLILFLNDEWSVEIDVELLATAFNISKADLSEMTIIEIPDLGTSNIKAVLCDEGAIQIYDTYYGIEPQRNAKGKFTNQHLSTDKILSWSNMYNVCVYYTGDTVPTALNVEE